MTNKSQVASNGADNLDANETIRLIAADKVEGTTVYNTEDEKLGSIENVMIDKQSGKVAYAVMSFGGFLGIDDDHHPLPWQVLKYDTDQGGFVVDLDKGMLEGAPRYGTNERVNWEDQAWGLRFTTITRFRLIGSDILRD